MNVRTVSLLLAALPALLSGQAPQRRPTVWIGPPGAEKGKALRALFEHPEEWKQTRTLVDGLLATGTNLNQFSDDELRFWFGRLREWKLRLMLEVGAVKEWAPATDVTFNRQRPTWDRFQNLGGSIHWIAMDEPCSARARQPYEYALEETVDSWRWCARSILTC